MIRKHGLGSKALIIRLKEFANGLFPGVRSRARRRPRPPRGSVRPASGIIDICEDQDYKLHDFVLVYAQMAGFHTKQTLRIVPFHPDTASFMLEFLRDLKPIMGVIGGQQEKDHDLETRLEKEINNKAHAASFGFLEVKPVRIRLINAMKNKLKITKGHPLVDCAVLAVQAITQHRCPGGSAKPDEIVPVMASVDVLTLVGALWTASRSLLKAAASKDDGEERQAENTPAKAKGNKNDRLLGGSFRGKIT